MFRKLLTGSFSLISIFYVKFPNFYWIHGEVRIWDVNILLSLDAGCGMGWPVAVGMTFLRLWDIRHWAGEYCYLCWGGFLMPKESKVKPGTGPQNKISWDLYMTVMAVLTDVFLRDLSSMWSL